MKLYDSVKEFHKRFGHPIDEYRFPTTEKSADMFRARLRWLYEEIGELEDAALRMDRVEFADALGDAIYIIGGWAVEYGIPIDEVFDAIHKSNMSKLGADGKPIIRDDGKVIKGPNFKPPTEDIRRLLSEASRARENGTVPR